MHSRRLTTSPFNYSEKSILINLDDPDWLLLCFKKARAAVRDSYSRSSCLFLGKLPEITTHGKHSQLPGSVCVMVETPTPVCTAAQSSVAGVSVWTSSPFRNSLEMKEWSGLSLKDVSLSKQHTGCVGGTGSDGSPAELGAAAWSFSGWLAWTSPALQRLQGFFSELVVHRYQVLRWMLDSSWADSGPDTTLWTNISR